MIQYAQIYHYFPHPPKLNHPLPKLKIPTSCNPTIGHTRKLRPEDIAKYVLQRQGRDLPLAC